MKCTNLKQVLLTIIIALLALSWAGAVSGMPPGWVGFHANLKGFPGWPNENTHLIPGEQNGKQSTAEVELRTTTVDEGQTFAPYGGFNGAGPIGNYPGGRPNGR